MKLLSAPEPLTLAAKLLQPLTTLAPNNIDVWISIYDVAIRRGGHLHFTFEAISLVYHYAGKHLQAVQALARARALNPEHPELHVRIIHAKLSGQLALQLIRRSRPSQ